MPLLFTNLQRQVFSRLGPFVDGSISIFGAMIAFKKVVLNYRYDF